VYSTVGVVVKKADSRHPKKMHRALVDMAQAENEAGFLLSGIDNLLMFCAIWWLFSLRMRVEVCSYLGMLLRPYF
jgi:hypothetical protein